MLYPGAGHVLASKLLGTLSPSELDRLNFPRDCVHVICSVGACVPVRGGFVVGGPVRGGLVEGGPIMGFLVEGGTMKGCLARVKDRLVGAGDRPVDERSGLKVELLLGTCRSGRRGLELSGEGGRLGAIFLVSPTSSAVQ